MTAANASNALAIIAGACNSRRYPGMSPKLMAIVGAITGAACTQLALESQGKAISTAKGVWTWPEEPQNSAKGGWSRNWRQRHEACLKIVSSESP